MAISGVLPSQAFISVGREDGSDLAKHTQPEHGVDARVENAEEQKKTQIPTEVAAGKLGGSGQICVLRG